jgi:hypothetical protein
MEFPISICPNLSDSAFASAFSNLLGIFSEGDSCLLISRVLFFSYFHFYHLFGLLFSFPTGRRYEDDSDTNA